MQAQPLRDSIEPGLETGGTQEKQRILEEVLREMAEHCRRTPCAFDPEHFHAGGVGGLCDRAAKVPEYDKLVLGFRRTLHQRQQHLLLESECTSERRIDLADVDADFQLRSPD